MQLQPIEEVSAEDLEIEDVAGEEIEEEGETEAEVGDVDAAGERRRKSGSL